MASDVPALCALACGALSLMLATRMSLLRNKVLGKDADAKKAFFDSHTFTAVRVAARRARIS